MCNQLGYEIDGTELDDVEIQGATFILDNRKYIKEILLDKD